MSQANVEIVLGLYPGSDVDMVPLFRDDGLWMEFAEALAPATSAGFECVSGIDSTARGATPVWMA
jgi:hypothetical protein